MSNYTPKSFFLRRIRQNPFLNEIYNKKTEEDNVIIVITGKTRSGKSWLALKLAECLDKKFYNVNTKEDAKEILNERISFFDPMRFYEIIKNPKLKYGDVVIMDEAGVAIGNKDAMTKENKKIMKNLQMFGHRRLITIFTVPYRDMIDKQARELIDYRIKVEKKNKKKKLTYAKVYWIDMNDKTGDIYEKFIKDYEDGLPVSYNFFVFKVVNPVLGKTYDEIADASKMKFTDESLKQSSLERDEEKEKQKKKKKIDYNQLAEHIKKKIDEGKIDRPTLINVQKEYPDLSVNKASLVSKIVKDMNE